MANPVGQYVCGRCFSDADHSYFLGTTTIYGVCVRCGGQASFMVDVLVNEPHVVRSDSVVSFSTSEAIVPFPSYVWDVNGYYREVHVPFWASRFEISRSYKDLGGPDDERLTYIVKQLFNADIRRRYDECPLGSIFYDAYYERIVKKRIEKEARDAIEQGDVDVDELEKIDTSDFRGKPVDLSKNRRDTRPSPWGHFLWVSTCDDQSRLSEWRSALVGAFSSKGVCRSLSVGFHAGREDPWVVHPVGEALVVFLHEDEKPTIQLATSVVDQITARRNK